MSTVPAVHDVLSVGAVKGGPSPGPLEGKKVENEKEERKRWAKATLYVEIKRKAPITRLKLRERVFRELRGAFEESYGRFLQIDLFAREGDSLLSRCGVPTMSVMAEGGNAF